MMKQMHFNLVTQICTQLLLPTVLRDGEELGNKDIV